MSSKHANYNINTQATKIMIVAFSVFLTFHRLIPLSSTVLMVSVASKYQSVV